MAKPVPRIAVNARGDRLGQDHPQAKLSDGDIELMRELRLRYNLSYAEIGRKFEVAKSHVWRVVNCLQRAQIPAGYKTATKPQ